MSKQSLVISVFLIAACGSGVGVQTGASSFCDNYCTRYASCKKDSDTQTCSYGCQDRSAATIPKLRGDLISNVQSCINNQDCATVLAGNGTVAYANCYAQNLATISASQAATDFCSAQDRAFAHCGRNTQGGQAICLNEAKPFNDAILQAAQHCNTLACGQIESCVFATLGRGFGYGSGPTGSSGGGKN